MYRGNSQLRCYDGDWCEYCISIGGSSGGGGGGGGGDGDALSHTHLHRGLKKAYGCGHVSAAPQRWLSG